MPRKRKRNKSAASLKLNAALEKQGVRLPHGYKLVKRKKKTKTKKKK